MHRMTRDIAIGLGILMLVVPSWAAPEALPLAETRTTYYHADIVGNVRAESNDAGTVTATHRYEPFGLVIPGESLSAEAPRFSGKLRDPVSGLDDFGARHFAAEYGRFLATDPVAFGSKRFANPQDLNLYGYALNNPFKYGDPDGRKVMLLNSSLPGIEIYTTDDPRDIYRIAGDSYSYNIRVNPLSSERASLALGAFQAIAEQRSHNAMAALLLDTQPVTVFLIGGEIQQRPDDSARGGLEAHAGVGGFAAANGPRNVVVINASVGDEQWLQKAIAHELGHVLLGDTRWSGGFADQMVAMTGLELKRWYAEEAAGMLSDLAMQPTLLSGSFEAAAQAHGLSSDVAAKLRAYVERLHAYNQFLYKKQLQPK